MNEMNVSLINKLIIPADSSVTATITLFHALSVGVIRSSYIYYIRHVLLFNCCVWSHAEIRAYAHTRFFSNQYARTTDNVLLIRYLKSVKTHSMKTTTNNFGWMDWCVFVPCCCVSYEWRTYHTRTRQLRFFSSNPLTIFKLTSSLDVRTRCDL